MVFHYSFPHQLKHSPQSFAKVSKNKFKPYRKPGSKIIILIPGKSSHGDKFKKKPLL